MPELNKTAEEQTLEEIEAAGLEAIAAANGTDSADDKGGQPGDKGADGGADDKGAPAAAAAAAADDKGADGEKVVYTEEFDLGNGEKVTFEAESLEALREKIIAGYRDLKAGKKPEGAAPAAAAAAASPAASSATPAAPGTGDGTGQPAPVKKGRKLTTDEEFAIEQEFKTGKPLKAMRDWLQTEFGMTLEEVSEAVETTKSTQREGREKLAVKKFRDKHPEFPPMTPTSIDLVRRYLDAHNQEATVENLEAAYAHYGDMLVPVKAADGAGTQPGAAVPHEPGKGAQPAAGDKGSGTPPKKVAASGLWGKQGARPPATVDKGKKPMSDAEMAKIAKEQGSDALLAALEDQHKAGVNT